MGAKCLVFLVFISAVISGEMWIVRYKALRAQLQKIHHEKKFGIGGGVVVKSRISVFVVFPLLGISGSDFSTLDIVSVLASLLFMVEA
jgi:hypothetical protein